MRKSYILWVEDDPDDEQLIRLALRAEKALPELVVVSDGVAVLDHFFSAGDGARDLPAVVVLDLKLPKVDGFEVLQRLRAHERTRLLPVVVFSSSRQAEDVERAYRLGANGYVCKAIDSSRFSSSVRALARYWAGCNEAPSVGVVTRP